MNLIRYKQRAYLPVYQKSVFKLPKDIKFNQHPSRREDLRDDFQTERRNYRVSRIPMQISKLMSVIHVIH